MRGQVRVSAAVVDHLVTLAASDVEGVLHTEGVVGGAVVGGVLGGVVGFAQAGPAGAAVGASVGSAAGAAATHLAFEQRQRRAFTAVTGTELPPLSVRVVARYGEDLAALAEGVRLSVEQAVGEVLGLAPTSVTVEIVDVLDPPGSGKGGGLDAPASPAPSSSALSASALPLPGL